MTPDPTHSEPAAWGMAALSLLNVSGWPLEEKHIYCYLEKIDLIGMETFC